MGIVQMNGFTRVVDCGRGQRLKLENRKKDEWCAQMIPDFGAVRRRAPRSQAPLTW
jgi:hypothetical protein